MNWKKVAVTALVCMSVSVPVWAAENASDEVTPNDWSYKALMTLEKHGAITDMKGISLGTQSYTRSQLTPLVAYVVTKRETMNESDRMLAIRLYSEYRDELMAYERDQEIEAEKAQGKTSGKAVAVPAKNRQTQRDEFRIERNPMKVNGDVRIRFQDGAGRGGRTDYRTRVAFVIGGNGTVAAPDELVDEKGKAALTKADEELAKSRKKAAQRMAAEKAAVEKVAAEKASAQAVGTKEATVQPTATTESTQSTTATESTQPTTATATATTGSITK